MRSECNSTRQQYALPDGTPIARKAAFLSPSQLSHKMRIDLSVDNNQ
jgi:hypothetical protein